MSQTRSARSATLEQVLVYYDGPQLALLKSSRGHPMLAVGVQRSGMHYPMFACEIIGTALEKYRYGRADLNYVFRSAPISRLFFVDFAELADGEARLIRATSDEARNRKYYPLSGIFSRSHTEEWENGGNHDEKLKTFEIDGTWEARDFSLFYAKLADVYSLSSIAADLPLRMSQEDKYDLRQSIEDKPWRGGGSYSSFYGSAKNHVKSNRPLRVASIEYHSPGYIKVAGAAADLQNVVTTVQNFVTQRAEITRVYKTIFKQLRSNGYLKAHKDRIFASETISKYLEDQSIKLANIVGLPNPHDVLRACEKNSIVFAKVVLSFTRRVGDLASFYMEGRIKSEGVEMDIISDSEN